MENRPRGRAHGRARGEHQQGRGSGPRPGPSQGSSRQGGSRTFAPQGAWGTRGASQQHQAPQGQWGPKVQQSQSQPPPQASGQQSQWGARGPPDSLPQQSAGRGPGTICVEEQQQTLAAQVRQTGGTDDETRGGGGGVKGRTNRKGIVDTKPKHYATKQGSDGEKILLKANFFPLLSATKWGLNQYRVDFKPELDNTKTRRALVRRAFVNKLSSGILFDGAALYTPTKLQPDPLELAVADDDNVKYLVSIRLVGEVNWGDWHYLQIFNLIVRRCLESLEFKLLGRNYFDPMYKVTIPQYNLELWPGYITSMRQHEKQIMLNIDLNFKVLRTDNVYDLLLECQNDRNARKEFQQRVMGCIVMTYYNNKTYRIDDVDYDQNPDSKFKKRDGTEISYRQYFEERYRVRITRNNQPMLISRSKPREIRAGMPEIVMLVPQLCTMTGLTEKQRENFQLMKSLSEHTRIGSSARMNKLREFSAKLQKCPKAIEELKKWDLKLAQDLVQFTGRVLPQETLAGGSGSLMPGPRADWTGNLKTATMFAPAKLDALVVVCPVRLKKATGEFVASIQQVARVMKFQISGVKTVDLGDDRAQSYLGGLEYAMSTLHAQLVFVVLTSNSHDKYTAVKKKCYVNRAMPCQVAVAKTVQKNNRSVAMKIAIQMNCKLGGSPWGSTMPRFTMVVGYDVCRDTANKGKSFAGMVASIDVGCSQYFSMAVEHAQEQELSSNIAAFVTLACEHFQSRNGVYPERIVVYRDGVGDGQIKYVKEHEVELLKEKLKSDLFKDRALKLAFIIVSKRINTKIFRAQADGLSSNPPAGTVVDDVITLPERYDFFLVSQCVNQGTVAPTSYNIIEDTLGIDANRIQRFTFKLTHMYFNWSGTIRVPAPCQYAHKLAFMTAQYLHRPAIAGLNETLYFM
ncbi:piwi-like protein Siwi [Rhynchophorus ferrugineus]|uniref:piwi-like protein Siwi n=1 Tax=Rhynchophorus ferrugineus TaxID=354439 RepID=UPI003FCEE2C2